MRREEFKKWMLKKKRIYCGKEGTYSESAVESRIGYLIRLETHFKLNLDSKVVDEQTAIQFLKDIREAHIEDLRHTPLSNAIRHYYEFSTGLYINKIF